MIGKAVHPFKTLWHGHVRAGGFFFPLIEPHAQRIVTDIFAQWVPGSKIYQSDLGVILLCPEPTEVLCQSHAGWPLCQQGLGLSSAPISKKVAATLTSQDVVVVVQGQLHTFSLSQMMSISPADLLDLSTWEVAQVIKPPKSAVVDDGLTPVATSIAEILHAPEPVQDMADIFKTARPAGVRSSAAWAQWAAGKLQALRGLFKQSAAKQLEKPAAPKRPEPAAPRKEKGSRVPFYFGLFALWLLVKAINHPSFTSASNAGEFILRVLLAVLVILAIFGVIYLMLWLIRALSSSPGGPYPVVPVSLPSQSGRVTGSQLDEDALSRWWRALKGWLTRQPSQPSSSAGACAQVQRKPLNEALMRSLMGKWLAGRQAKYMRRMLQMFEDQDLENALRYAIPLDDGSGTNLSPSPATGVPDPRKDLRISLQRGAGAGSIYTSHDVNEYLRKIYRQAFEKFNQQKNIERAAFVLAELLGNVTEAVDYLEAHGLLQQAVELAQARGNDPVMAIRLWIKLGDKKRALLLTQQTNSYLSAISLFDSRGEKDTANELRCLYAQVLETRGSYEEAMDTLMPLIAQPNEREHIQRLLRKGLAQGDKVSARMLAWQALLEPQANDAIVDYYRRHFEGADEQAALLRFEFASNLFLHVVQSKGSLPWTPAAQRLMEHAIRQIVQDRYLYDTKLNQKTLDQWLTMCGNTTLRTDKAKLGKVPQRAAVPRQKRASQYQTVEHTQGMGIFDAGFAHDANTFVLALGEAGVDVVKVDQCGKRTLRHFSCVAHHLVISDNAMRVLALAALDNSNHLETRVQATLYKVYVLELDTGKSHHYGTLTLEQFAKTYDGNNWFAYGNDRAQLFDMQAGQPTSIWSVGGFSEKRLVSLAREYTWLNLCFTDKQQTEPAWIPGRLHENIREKDFEVWQYSDNGARLKSREQVKGEFYGEKFDIMPESRPLMVSVYQNHPLQFYVRTLEAYNIQGEFCPLNTSISSATRVQFQRDMGYGYLMQIASGEEGSSLAIYGYGSDTRVWEAEWFFPDAATCGYRLMFRENKMLIWDNCGRVIVLDIQQMQQELAFVA